MDTKNCLVKWIINSIKMHIISKKKIIKYLIKFESRKNIINSNGEIFIDVRWKTKMEIMF
jgi:hypothetical protein